MSDNLVCRICQSIDLVEVIAREMMFGFRDKFIYYECNFCGCVQISEYPRNIYKYYPPTYYSYSDSNDDHVPEKTRISPIKAVKNMIRRLIPSLRRWPKPLHEIYSDNIANKLSPILDVGCGSGALVRQLRATGFVNAVGIDPFIKSDLFYRNDILVKKQTLENETDKYFCISFNHSLEHMENQKIVLRTAAELLSHDGFILVRVPIVGGFAWRSFRENWVQLDAPRHFYLHSRKSLSLVAQAAGLTVTSVSYDSRGFQLWGSWLYTQDIPLTHPRSPAVNRHSSVFSLAQLNDFDRKAWWLNRAEDGDQIVAILRKDRTR